MALQNLTKVEFSKLDLQKIYVVEVYEDGLSEFKYGTGADVIEEAGNLLCPFQVWLNNEEGKVDSPETRAEWISWLEDIAGEDNDVVAYEIPTI